MDIKQAFEWISRPTGLGTEMGVLYLL